MSPNALSKGLGEVRLLSVLERAWERTVKCWVVLWVGSVTKTAVRFLVCEIFDYMGFLIHAPPEPPPGHPGPPPGPPGAPPEPLSGWFSEDSGVQTDLKKAFFGACRPCIKNCTVV